MIDHLKSLTAKIIAAVPEIVEKKPGAKAMLNGKEVEIFAKSGNLWLALNKKGELESFDDYAKVEIIGRPITLEDVMRIFPNDARYGLRLNFEKRCMEFTDNWTTEHYDWILGKPLPLQSPETIKFLDELIPALSKT